MRASGDSSFSGAGAAGVFPSVAGSSAGSSLDAVVGAVEGLSPDGGSASGTSRDSAGAVASAGGVAATTIRWELLAIFLILTPLYLCRVQKVMKISQLIISTVSFAVWVFALGGPFSLCSWYDPVYGAVLLPVFTLTVAIAEAD